jgi:hypothetical protein
LQKKNPQQEPFSTVSGDIATFGKQILLPINRQSQREGSIVIGLQYL